MTYKELNELKTLSTEVFGNTSKWRKLMDKGKVNLLVSKKKNKISEVEWFTFDTLKLYLLDLKAQKQAKLDEMKKSIDSK